jgi:hypothetical protein
MLAPLDSNSMTTANAVFVDTTRLRMPNRTSRQSGRSASILGVSLDLYGRPRCS